MLHCLYHHTNADHSTSAGSMTAIPSSESEIPHFPDGHVPRLAGIWAITLDYNIDEIYFLLEMNTWAVGDTMYFMPHYALTTVTARA